jgi:chromosome partitioning protein
MAINTLANVLPRWARSATQMKHAFRDSSYPFPNRNPKFGGVVMQRFNIRNGMPAAPFRNNMDEILAAVQDTLLPSLTRNDMTFPLSVYEAANFPENYGVAEIPDFQSLLPQSHTVGVPVYALLDYEINRTGTVLSQMIGKRDTFDQLFIDFAILIEALKDNA